MSNTSFTINLYIAITYIVTIYIFGSRIINEPHLYSFSLVTVKSKTYMSLLVNFILANYIMIGLAIVKIFFGEIRVSELLGIVDKIKNKIVTFMLLFISMRPQIDISKLLIIIHVYFVIILNMLTFNRAAYLMTAEASNPNARKQQYSILYVHVALFFLNYFSYIAVTYPLIKIGVDFFSLDYFNFSGLEGKNASDVIIYCIFTCEIIYCQLKLFVKFVKLTIELTELVNQKEWEHKKITVLLFDFFRYFFKAIFAIKFLGLTIKSGVFPLFLFIDMFYSVWNVAKQGYKLWEFIHLKRMIGKLENFNIEEAENDLSGTEQTKDGKKYECICLDEVKIGKKLPCGHIFHEQCIR